MPTAPYTPTRKRPRRRRRGGRMFLLLLILAAIGCGIFWRLHRAPPAPKPTLEEDWVAIEMLPKNKYSRPGLPLRQINGVVIHYTGNPNTSAEQTVSYYTNLAETGETFASSHFVIGMDGTIIQCIPLDEEAYCSNSRNVDTISIECCHPDKSGVFTDETYQSLVKLTRYLVRGYRLDERQVIRHYDVTGKLCPYHYATNEDAWNAFKEDVFRSSLPF